MSHIKHSEYLGINSGSAEAAESNWTLAVQVFTLAMYHILISILEGSELHSGNASFPIVDRKIRWGELIQSNWVIYLFVALQIYEIYIKTKP